MAAGNTYVALATNTLSSATASVTFSSISGAYTDLVLICNIGASASTSVNFGFNGDTGTNYSTTILTGNGTTAASARTSTASNSTDYIAFYTAGAPSGLTGSMIFNVMNYANTTTNKTILARSGSDSKEIDLVVGLWRSTAAITSIVIGMQTGNFITGSTFTLYGIAAA